MLKEVGVVGVVKVEVTVGRVLVLEICEAFVLLVVELELEVIVLGVMDADVGRLVKLEMFEADGVVAELALLTLLDRL